MAEMRVIDPSDPYKTAGVFADEKNGKLLFSERGSAGFSLLHSATELTRYSAAEIRSQVYEWLSGSMIDTGNGILEAMKPTKKSVDQVMDALKAYCFDDCDEVAAATDAQRERVSKAMSGRG